ncbi:sulfite exporter TauE/SafE family protein [[Pseudomonas] carboxydohydrogena]|uniref:Probable membrane transporter protein n=1 Tax=Afipia carboxydohydrogena TaxID=290 RepID=A0ABY8BMA0_AFICR|nr:sulfite exporter TauE/SafE family protein [[Pseudomonas] carboxydohydrogena]WEF50809.1 sulfite exporter TauE/SafE family protein [[Pseudomonas] carboxydohydrogena]
MHDLVSFGLTAFILFGAYTLFGITGFGQSMIAMPFLAMVASLKFFVPLVALLDTVFVVWNMTKFRKQANYKELIALLPTTIIGMIGGATMLVLLPERILLLTLGVLITAYGLYRLATKQHAGKLNKFVAVPLGLLAGALSATFGTGGPIYVAYLSGRIFDKSELRATILGLILLTAIFRIGAFGIGGLYDNTHIWLWWLMALPFCFAGVKLGHYLHDRLKSESLLTLVYLTLVISGVTLLIKNF